ncbi:MAG: uracil-DNA glycosylase family protein [Rhodospirillales bacterium]|nr:uracil-DNA glycosylase family protein [Rhodospirillales bacterium]
MRPTSRPRHPRSGCAPWKQSRSGSPNRWSRSLPPVASSAELAALLDEIRGCRVCAAVLPLGPRPVVRASTTARLLIVGQAPGTKVHATGIPWNDPSGERLRAWLGLDPATFYDASRIAIVPMGLCYPGRLPRGGDAPPRPECAKLWRARVLAQLASVRLTLLVGGYAIADAMGSGSMTAQVARWRALLPGRCALPHPSWRTLAWERRNPWFAQELLPALRAEIARVLL